MSVSSFGSRSGRGENELGLPVIEVVPAHSFQVAHAAKYAPGHIVVAHEQVEREAGDNLYHLDDGDPLGVVQAKIPAAFGIVAGERI